LKTLATKEGLRDVEFALKQDLKDVYLELKQDMADLKLALSVKCLIQKQISYNGHFLYYSYWPLSAYI
jgi:hypothetical protein